MNEFGSKELQAAAVAELARNLPAMSELVKALLEMLEVGGEAITKLGESLADDGKDFTAAVLVGRWLRADAKLKAAAIAALAEFQAIAAVARAAKAQDQPHPKEQT
jgi:hypothetical protein